MLRSAALLTVVLVAAGCGSSKAAREGPAPTATRHYLVYARETGQKGVWIADVDGSHPRFLVPGGGPLISPDGKSVLYGGDDRDYVVSTELGAKPRPLGAETGWPTKWTPDSKAIVTTLAVNESKDALVRIDVSTGEQATLAEGGFSGWSLSPDGRRIVFALEEGKGLKDSVFPSVDLYVTDLDGRGDPKSITNTGDNAYPVWGPKSIAFAKLVPLKQPGRETEFARNELWRIRPDGTQLTTISGPLPERLVKGFWHCIGLEPVDWSDDGSALLAEVNCEGIGQTVAVDPQTGAIRSLGEGTFTVGLSQDAQFALVQWGDERVGPENERVLIYPYAGGKPTVVAKGAFGPSWNR